MGAAEQIAAEIERRRADPLAAALSGLTAHSRYGAGNQREFLYSPARQRVIEGGNQSGKTWAACLDFLLQARGKHPIREWTAPPGETWRGWYTSTTYERFSEQGWKHFKSLLLYPGESIRAVPTRNVLALHWDKRDPERPLYLKLRRVDGGIAEVWIKSYDQGPAEFQAAEVDALVLDEECPRSIYDEVQPRVLVRAGGIVVAATPVLNVEWLEALREDAETGGSDVYHCRLDVRDNPAADWQQIEEMQRVFRNRPDMLKLRLSGIPLVSEGAVYSDLQFTPAHVCDPFTVAGGWTKYLAIDPGWQGCGALWLAVNRAGDVVVYREYLGVQRTVGENAEAIRRLCGAEEYERIWIDPAARGTQTATGKTELDLYREAGLEVRAAPATTVVAGIEAVWRLLGERGGVNGERPRLRVFKSCIEFLRERRAYRFHEAREDGDLPALKPLKRNDHLLDPWRYAVVGGLNYVEAERAKPPPAGTMGRRLWEKRREHFKGRV